MSITQIKESLVDWVQQQEQNEQIIPSEAQKLRSKIEKIFQEITKDSTACCNSVAYFTDSIRDWAQSQHDKHHRFSNSLLDELSLKISDLRGEHISVPIPQSASFEIQDLVNKLDVYQRQLSLIDRRIKHKYQQLVDCRKGWYHIGQHVREKDIDDLDTKRRAMDKEMLSLCARLSGYLGRMVATNQTDFFIGHRNLWPKFNEYCHGSFNSPLKHAFLQENKNMIQFFIQEKFHLDDDKSPTYIELACSVDKTNLIPFLLDLGVQPKNRISAHNGVCSSELRGLIASQRYDLALALIEKGARDTGWDFSDLDDTGSSVDVDPIICDALCGQNNPLFNQLFNKLKEIGASEVDGQNVFFIRKLSSLMGLEGEVSCIDQGGHSHCVDLEGFKTEPMLQELKRDLELFFHSDVANQISLTPEEREIIRASFQEACVGSPSLSLESLIQKLHSPMRIPTIILREIPGHATGLVFYNNQYAICDRSDCFSTFQSGISIAEHDLNRVPSDILHSLVIRSNPETTIPCKSMCANLTLSGLNGYEALLLRIHKQLLAHSINSFVWDKAATRVLFRNKTVNCPDHNPVDLDHLFYHIPQHGQTVGNCTSASAKSLFLALLFFVLEKRIPDPEARKIESIAIYKKFTTFQREHALEQYFSTPMERPHSFLQVLKEKIVTTSRISAEKKESFLSQIEHLMNA